MHDMYDCAGQHMATVPASATYDDVARTFTLVWRCARCDYAWSEAGVRASWVQAMLPVWTRETGCGRDLLPA